MTFEEMTKYPTMPSREFDAAAEAAGFDLRARGWLVDAQEHLKRTREPGPYKYASARCESGRRDYCTCDTCF